MLHPNMADLYRQKVIPLARGLEFEESRSGAAEALRGLIDAIVLTPQKGELRIELQGDLAARLTLRRRRAPVHRWRRSGVGGTTGFACSG